MTSLRLVATAALATLLAATATASGKDPATSTPTMRELPSTRTADDGVAVRGDLQSDEGRNYNWDGTDAERHAMQWPVDESRSSWWGLAVFGSAAFMFMLTIAGLTLTYRSLRAEMRRNRVHYRPRGPQTTGEIV